eukprot:12893024-Prorocentrum_lima.AAC.1
MTCHNHHHNKWKRPNSSNVRDHAAFSVSTWLATSSSLVSSRLQEDQSKSPIPQAFPNPEGE